MMWFKETDNPSVTYHFWITEPITNRHALKVDFHLGSGVVFMDVVRNGRNILPCIRLLRQRKDYMVTNLT